MKPPHSPRSSLRKVADKLYAELERQSRALEDEHPGTLARWKRVKRKQSEILARNDEGEVAGLVAALGWAAFQLGRRGPKDGGRKSGKTRRAKVESRTDDLASRRRRRPDLSDSAHHLGRAKAELKKELSRDPTEAEINQRVETVGRYLRNHPPGSK